MKILHFADLHLGVETYGRTDPGTGLSTRILDCLAALDYLVDYAIAEHVDLVLFCGDAYKTREPNQTHQREFAKRINKLSAANIPTLLLTGNHDLHNAVGRATSTEIFDTLAVKNIHVANKPDIYQIPTASGTVQIAALPWLRRSVLIGKEETKNLTLEQLNRRAEEILTGIVASHAAKLDPSLPAVLAAHVWVTGGQAGTEKNMTIGQEHTLLLSNVALSAFDYVALGHLHRHQILKEKPPVVYAGSLYRLDFGDEKDEKGFYIVEIDPAQRQTRAEFHPVPDRRFLTINVAIAADEADPTAAVLRAVAEKGNNVKDSILRLNITLPASLEGQLRDNEIRSALKDAHYAAVAREVQREVRARLGNFTAEELTPLEALQKYLEAKSVPPERAKVLLEYGEKLIGGQKS
ncbi:MAG: exonuclease SbcCD subunit D [Dehalococcoidales bacterium]|nr:exonuclease SbcCD subunit D [Dehalococcoidales bacterium]